MKLGEEGKPFIRQLIAQASTEEAKSAASAALSQIDENRVLGPSYISLNVKDAPPGEVFEQIQKQCFAQILTTPDNLWDQGGFTKLTMTADRKPFWEVVPEVCRHYGVGFQPFYRGGMRLMRGGGMQLQGLTSIQGAFLIVATHVNYSRTRVLGPGGQTQRQFGIQFVILPEPKITVLRGQGMIDLAEAVDDHGNSLVPARSKRAINYGGFIGWGGNLYAPLQYPAKNPGTKIVRFRGTTSMLVQTKVQELRVDDVMNMHDVGTVVNGLRVTLNGVTKRQMLYELHVTVARPNFGSAEWQLLMEEIQSKLKLVDAAGRELDHRGTATNSMGNRVELTVNFGSTAPLNRDPSKLLWDIPLESKNITVPVVFGDIPLFGDGS